MKCLKFIIPLGIFVALVLFLRRRLRLDLHEVRSSLIDKPAPAVVLTRLDDARKMMRRDRVPGLRCTTSNVRTFWPEVFM
jgi:cytochrome c biogenesis protein CcmG/thiol:disulfide interchange protein DsbE